MSIATLPGYITVSAGSLTPVTGNDLAEASSAQVYVGFSQIVGVSPLAGVTPGGAAYQYGVGSPSAWGFYLKRAPVINGTVGAFAPVGTTGSGLNINLSAITNPNQAVTPSGASTISTNGGGGYAYLDTTVAPGSSYVYQLVVSDTIYGAVGTAVTPVIYTTPVLAYSGSLTATTVTNSTVGITPSNFVPFGNPWANTFSASGPVYTGYTYAWYRSTSNGVRGSALSGQTSLALSDTTVSASTPYYYTASVSDGYNTAYSAQLAVTTLNATVVTGAPTLVSYNSNQVVLNTGAVSGGVPPYTIQWKRSTTSGSGYANLSGQTGTTLTDNTALPSTAYFYVYVATDSASDTTQSAQIAVTTYAALTVAAPTQTSVTATTANLADTGSTGGSGVYLYQWYRSTLTGFAPSLGTLLTGQISLTLVDSGLNPSTNYFYVLVAADTAGDNVNSAQLSVTTSAGPLAIGPLTEITTTVNSATISAPNPSGGVPPYTFSWYRSASIGVQGSALSFTTQTITDFGADLTPPGLLSDTNYYYTCEITDSATPTANTANSVQLAVTTTVPDLLGAYYSNLLIYQYVNQPNASATINAIAGALTLPASSVQTSDNLLPLVIQNAFNLPTATGVQLNIIGKYQGVSRFITTAAGAIITLSDADFRTLIQIAAANNLVTQNLGGVTVPSQSLAGIDDFLYNNFPGLINITDLTDMEIGYVINPSIGSSNLVKAIISEDLLPKPLGVLISYIIVPPTPGIGFFGFSTIISKTQSVVNPITVGFNDASVGFVYGPWLDITWNEI